MTSSNYFDDVADHIFYPHLDDLSLNIAIIGAGIAGLSAAAGLRRSGHQVELFERSRFSNEIGAAINVCPNASRVLRYWGFDFERANAVSFGHQRVLSGNDLDIKLSSNYDFWTEKYGAPAYFLHRVDLHNGLKELALEADPKLPPTKLHVSSEVIDLDCETGTLTLANGQTYQKDIIIVADGVHSRFVKIVTGNDTPATPTGQSAFRFLVPTEKLLETDAKVLIENTPCSLDIATLGDRRLVWYPCRSGTLYNFVGIHPEIEGEDYVEAWNVAAPLQKLLETYKNFHPKVLAACRAAEDLKLWKLLFRSPIAPWTKGKVVLIGDAAHPMLPHQGQGGGQAIEDGGALGALFSHVRSANDISERMRLFENLRRNRASAMQMFSNAGQDEAEKIEKDAQPFVDGPVPKTLEEYHDYNFGYNVLREGLQVMESHDKDFAKKL